MRRHHGRAIKTPLGLVKRHAEIDAMRALDVVGIAGGDDTVARRYAR